MCTSLNWRFLSVFMCKFVSYRILAGRPNRSRASVHSPLSSSALKPNMCDGYCIAATTSGYRSRKLLSTDPKVFTILIIRFYQRVSIASYASAGIARAEMSVRLSVTLRYCIKTKKASVMIFSGHGVECSGFRMVKKRVYTTL